VHRRGKRAGKSNLFDAIQFLSLLASRSLIDAAQEVRGVAGKERLGDPRDLFWNGCASGEHRMKFAAEMIVPQHVEDDFGRQASPSITYLRYELELGYIPPTGVEKIGRLGLLSESLRHIRLGDAASRLRFPHSTAKFRDAVLTGRRSGTAINDDRGHSPKPAESCPSISSAVSGQRSAAGCRGTRRRRAGAAARVP